LVVGSTEASVIETKIFKERFIAYYGYPEWNKQIDI
jgi:hypothetical protein